MTASSVLVAVRGDQCDDEVVKLACSLTNPQKGMVHILYVIEVERGVPVDAEVAPATAKGEEVLKHMELVAKGFKCKAEAELVQTRQAGSAVVQEAIDKDADTIILGSSYREQYGSFSLGDTIPYVLRHARCRVIVWRDSPSRIPANGQTP